MSKIFPFNPDGSQTLQSPKELKEKLPATLAQTQFVEQSRQQVRQILRGEDPRTLAIVGPCSIHDPRSAIDFARRMKTLSDEISDFIMPVMRVYFEKPRTVLGWKGFMYDPHLNGSYDVPSGVALTRELFLTLADLEIPLAAEFLDPLSCHYFEDLITWGCIGARTSSSQVHRQMASRLPLPVAFKNNTDGNIEIAVNGAVVSSEPQTFLSLNDDGRPTYVKSEGNPDSHIVLRGGKLKPNYDPLSVTEALNYLKTSKQPERLIIDCSHDNSRRDPYKQKNVLRSVIDQIVMGNHAIKGFIMESHIEEGSQTIPDCTTKLKYGVSITDACLDWKTTESLIKDAYIALKTKSLERVCSI